MQTEKLPSDVLGKIMYYVLVLDAPSTEICALCRLPMWFLMMSDQAKALRYVNSRWDRVFRDKLLLVAIHMPSGVWCLQPERCARKYLERIDDRVRITHPVYYTAQRQYDLNMLLYSSGDDETSLTSESEESD